MKNQFVVLVGSVAIVSAPLSALAQSPAAEGARFTKANELVRPANFREWVFLSSGLGMTYNEDDQRAPSQNFTNVYVHPTAYRSFLKSGRWPDKTIFVLEIRGSASEGSINKGGRFQTDLVALEAEVKDEKRFPTTKWGYFNFGRAAALAEKAAPQPESAGCFACHSQHGAVDGTFVQFYPTLLDVAKRLKTLER